jgi:hypothetical protein
MLLELYRHCGEQSIQESQVLQVIRRFSTPDSPVATYLLEQICKLGFMEYSPGADMLYEMPHTISKLLGYLLQEYRLTSTEVIQGYLQALDRFCNELEHATQQKNGDTTARILSEADENIERMRSDSHNNRQRIIAECIKAKINREKLSVRQRFELINHLYEKYLEPMRDMIDVSKEMDSQLERMQRVFVSGTETFIMERHVRQLFEQSSARLLRLKRDIDSDFRESYRELMPLYERYRKESMIASGAATALKEISNHGFRKMLLASKVGLCQFRTQWLIPDGELEAYMYNISDYQPQYIKIDPEQSSKNLPVFISMLTLKQLLKGIAKIDDVLEWVLSNFPNESLAQHLRIYGMFYTQLSGDPSFAPYIREYSGDGAVLRAHPMSFKVREYE